MATVDGKEPTFRTAHIAPPRKRVKIRILHITLPSRGPKIGQNCYVTPAFSGVPKKGDKNGPRGADGGQCLKKARNKKKSGFLTTAVLVSPGQLHFEPLKRFPTLHKNMLLSGCKSHLCQGCAIQIHECAPPLVQATQRYAINTVPTPPVAWP